ncbi:MAG: hypothetical protein ACR2J8_08945, partial [Thermomicrobiales bacterium]
PAPSPASAGERGWGSRLALALGLLALAVSPVAGQVATPYPLPDVPDPALCDIAPVGEPALNGAIESADIATPEIFRNGVVPEGRPASPEQAAVVYGMVRRLVACYSAGELLRAYALFTPGYLNRVFGKQGGYTDAAYDSLATPQPAESGKRVKILDIDNIRMLDDGRVAATVILEYAVIPMPKRFLMVFADDGEEWKIDDILGEISFSVP